MLTRPTIRHQQGKELRKRCYVGASPLFRANNKKTCASEVPLQNEHSDYNSGTHEHSIIISVKNTCFWKRINDRAKTKTKTKTSHASEHLTPINLMNKRRI